MHSRPGVPLVVAALALFADTSLACSSEKDDADEVSAPKHPQYEGTMTSLIPSTKACHSLPVGVRTHVPATVTRNSIITECDIPETGGLGCGGGSNKCVSAISRDGTPIELPIHAIGQIDCRGPLAAGATDAVVQTDCEAELEDGDVVASKASPGSASIFVTVIHEGLEVAASGPLVVTFSEQPRCDEDIVDAGHRPDAADGGADASANADAASTDDGSASDAASD